MSIIVHRVEKINMTSKESGDRLYEKMEEYQVDVPDRGGSASNGKYGCAGGRAGRF